MKKLLTACIILLCSISNSTWSQTFAIDPIFYTVFDQDSLTGFDDVAARASAISEGFLGSEFKIKMYRLKREFINNKYNLAVASRNEDILTPYLAANRPAAVPGCVNEDFEASTAAVITVSNQINGWVVTSGYNSGISASSTSTMLPYYPGGLSNPNSCNLLGCCPLPPQNSELIDCSAPGGFIDGQVGNQYPIYSVFGSGSPNAAANAVNPQVTGPMFGGKIIRINDGLTSDWSMEKLSKTFAVTASNALFQFAFISVFSPGHGCCDAGGFQIRLTNATANTVIPCPSFSVSAPSSQCTATVPVDYFVALTGAPYTTTTSANNIYNRWKINSIDLSAYIGQNITIDIIVSDCTAGGHYGKVYFDAQCGPMVISGNGVNFDAGVANVIVPTCGASGATICAAAGLGPYYWAGPNITPNQATPSMTNQCFTSTISATYTLYMQPEGSCNPISRVVTSTITPAPLLNASAVQATCGNTIAIVTVTPSGSAANPSSLIWSPNPLSMNTTSTSSQYVIPSGQNTMVVSVTASDPLGCLITATVGVNPAPPYPTFTLVNMSNSYSITCTTPVVQLDANSLYNYNNGSLNYFWSSNSATFTGNSNFITTAGLYTIYAFDPVTNCGVTNTVFIGQNTTPPSSSVSPISQVINCNMPVAPDVTLTSGQAVNVTHYVLSPLGGTFAAAGQTTFYPIGVPGTYTYCLQNDINGCTTCKEFTVSANQGFPTFNVSSNPTSFTLGCNSKSVTTININNASATNTNQIATGGPVSYTLFSPGSSGITPTGTLSAAASYSVNSPGTWTVVVKDNTSFCESRLPISVLTNTFPPDISVAVPQRTLSCNVPRIVMQGQSLTNNVSYEWGYQSLNQSTDTIAVNINPVAPSNSVILIYTLTITDNNSTCKSTSVVTMYQNLFVPKILVALSTTSISCKTPSVTLTNQSTTGILAGTGYPTNLPVVGFVWEGPTPQEPLNNSTTYLGLTPGVYTLTGKDLNNGCVNTGTVYVDDARDFPNLTILPTTLDCGSLYANINPTLNLNTKSGTITYKWSAGLEVQFNGSDSKIDFHPDRVGEYSVLVTDLNNGCQITYPATVVNGSLAAKFVPDVTSGFAPLTVNFDNQSRSSLDPEDITALNLVKSFWNFGNGTTFTVTNTIDATTIFSNPGSYTVTLYANKGTCVQSYQKVITVELPSKLIIPNIFTPNNDKVNDVFRLDVASLTDISMVILDRWGHVVYELNNSTTGNVEWDGKNQKGVDCAEGIYFYSIKATGADGITFDKTGNITLAR